MLVTDIPMGKPYRPKDPYFLKAKKEGLRARSAFKIEEIIRRFGLLESGSKVLDLGAAPGGFLEILAKFVGPKGVVLGIDAVPIRPLPYSWVKTAALDVLAQSGLRDLAQLFAGEFDAVISDLAPKTSGIRTTDVARSVELASRALEIALARGQSGSHFVVKLFMGSDFEKFRDQLRHHYQDVKIVRPAASRAGSMEVYLVALGKRG